MNDLFQKYKLFFLILMVAAAGFLLWYFSHIVIFILVAVVISIIGAPMVDFLDRIRIGKFRIPHTVSVILTLLVILFVFLGIFSLFIPLVLKEAELISNIDGKQLSEHFRDDIRELQRMLVKFGIMPRGTTIESATKQAILKIIDFGMFSNVVSSVISFTGTFFFNLFSIAFLSFFFLKDNRMIPRFILWITPSEYSGQTKNIMYKSRDLLSRYFIGLILQIFLNIITYSLALYIIGVENFLVIGFFTGIIIIVPYLGGIISMLTGLILGLTSVIAMGEYAMIFPMAVKILIAMLIVQTIDNNIFTPMIQGKSVKAHPVEIFLVVIAAGSVGGILGMVIAVPAYGFFKIIALEYIQTFRLKQKMTEND